MTEQTPKQAAHEIAKSYIERGFKPASLHVCEDADGDILYWRIRAIHENGKKYIRPMYENGNGYELGLPVFPNGKPIYKLPLVASDAESTVWIVEGEQCVDSLVKLGLIATTSGGATSAGEVEWNPLQGRKVVIWPDADTDGASDAAAVVEQLSAIAASIRVVNINNLELPEKGDCVDWLAAYPDTTADDINTLDTVEAPERLIEVIEDWASPEPLPGGLPGVEALAEDMIPQALRPWVMDIADRMQIPPDFAAATAIVALGSLLGRRLAIHPKKQDDWVVVPNLWGGIVARPSLMKSPVISETMKPINQLIVEANSAFKVEQDAHELDAELYDSEKRARRDKPTTTLRKDDDAKVRLLKSSTLVAPEKPVLRRYKTSDTTTEKLGAILLENPNGILVCRDELSGWLRNLDPPTSRRRPRVLSRSVEWLR